MNFKKRLQYIFLSLLLIVPNFVLAYSNEVVLGGKNIGIEINAKNIIIVGFYKVDNKYIASESGFQVGDEITKINGIKVNNITDMLSKFQNNLKDNKVEFTINRNNKELSLNLEMPKESDNSYKTGIYVKDKISGIGTLTYIDPATNIFGALGHEITEKTTAQKIEIKDGKIYSSYVTGITKSRSGIPGEKNASFNINEVYGAINKNESSGIFGIYNNEYSKNNLIKIANQDEIELGKAYIRTVIDKSNEEEYEINIIRIDKDNKTKNILFEITDKDLLNKTGGVVSGMSGSPIIQNNKLIGAVTHVVVNNAAKGYAIFITTMLKEGEN